MASKYDEVMGMVPEGEGPPLCGLCSVLAAQASARSPNFHRRAAESQGLATVNDSPSLTLATRQRSAGLEPDRLTSKGEEPRFEDYRQMLQQATAAPLSVVCVPT